MNPNAKNINLDALKAERSRLQAEHERWDATAKKATEARSEAKLRLDLLDKLIRLGELYVAGGGEEPIPF